MLARADGNLYEAKRAGRNRVVGLIVRFSRQIAAGAEAKVAQVH